MSKQRILGLKYGFPEQKKEHVKPLAPAQLFKDCEIWEYKKDFPELAELKQNKLYVLKLFKLQLKLAFTELRERNLLHEIKEIDSPFNVRLIRGSKTEWSIHSWAAAVDMNAADNPLNGKVSWSSEFLHVMRKYVDCGAYFNRVDGMHFEIKL